MIDNELKRMIDNELKQRMLDALARGEAITKLADVPPFLPDLEKTIAAEKTLDQQRNEYIRETQDMRVVALNEATCLMREVVGNMSGNTKTHEIGAETVRMAGIFADFLTKGEVV